MESGWGGAVGSPAPPPPLPPERRKASAAVCTDQLVAKVRAPSWGQWTAPPFVMKVLTGLSCC